MRTVIQWVGAGAVGALLVFGCSSSDSDVQRANAGGAAGNSATIEAGSPGTVEAGSPGTDERAGAGGSAGTPAASGGAPTEPEDVAGAAGEGGACAGNYACPAVGYDSKATIQFDLPISVAAAADAVFTACRNSECHTAKGSATVDKNGNPLWGWAEDASGSNIYLTFDNSGAAPYGVLRWDFQLDFETIPRDHYSLAVQPVGASTPTTLFDTEVSYTTKVSDPTLVSEGFCRHCSEVSVAELDLRTNH